MGGGPALYISCAVCSVDNEPISTKTTISAHLIWLSLNAATDALGGSSILVSTITRVCTLLLISPAAEGFQTEQLKFYWLRIIRLIIGNNKY